MEEFYRHRFVVDISKKEENESLSEIELQNLGNELKRNEWKKLGRCLGLKDASLDAIEFNNKENGLEEVCFQMLLTWKHSFASLATRKQLAEALRDIKRNDLLHIVIKYGVEESAVELDQETYNRILQELQRNMHNIYAFLQLPRVSWLRDKNLPLEELYVDLTLQQVDIRGTKVIELDLKLEEIFKDVESKQPKRILIEGDPGYGKTTLICKLATDWANEKPYIRKRFSLVFIIVLRYFEGSLDKVIFEHITNQEFSESEVLHTIKKVEEEILLILDGFDELDDISKESFYPLLKGSIYPSMTIVVTSRTGEILIEDLGRFNEKKHKNALFLIGAKNNLNSSFLLWDKRIQIKGISEENRKQFFHVYLEKNLDTFNEDMNRLINENIRHLCECPMFLILIAILIEDKEISAIENRTHLFIKMINFLIKRNLQRENLTEGEEFDIFSYDKDEPPFYVTFGKLALEKLKNNKLSFSEEELIKYCDNKRNVSILGILSKNISFGNRKRTKTYECIHKSFLEFLAAFYVTDFQFHEKKINEFKEMILSFMRNEYTSKHYLFFLSFVIGLLKDKACIVFEFLKPYAAFLPVTGEFFRNIYFEIKLTNENILALIPFIPPLWKIDRDEFFSSYLHSQLLHLANDKALINNFVWNLKYKAKIPHSFYVNILHLKLDETVCDNTKEALKISCRHFTLHVTMAVYNWQPVVELTNNLQCEKMSFIIRIHSNDNTLSLFQKEFMEGKWHNKMIYHVMFEVYPQATLDVIDAVRLLIETKRIEEKVVISFVEFPNWIQTSKIQASLDQLLKTVGRSSFLEKFLFYIAKNTLEIDVSADFSPLLGDRDKQWKFLFVDKCVKWKDAEKIPENNSFESIMISERRMFQLDTDALILAQCTRLEKLMVTSDLFFRLINVVNHDWKGFNTINFIELTLKESFENSHFDFLGKFQNLETLILMLTDNLMTSVDVSNLTNILFNLSLNLFYVTASEDNLNILKSLLQEIKEQSPKKTIKHSYLTNTGKDDKHSENTNRRSNYSIENLKFGFFFPNEFIREKELMVEIFLLVKTLLEKKIIKKFYSNSSSNLAERLFYYHDFSNKFVYAREVQIKMEGNYCKYFDVNELEPISVTYAGESNSSLPKQKIMNFIYYCRSMLEGRSSLIIIVFCIVFIFIMMFIFRIIQS